MDNVGINQNNDGNSSNEKIRNSNLIQIELVLDYYSKKAGRVISIPTNEEFGYWINNFSFDFKEIRKSGEENIDNIKKRLYV